MYKHNLHKQCLVALVCVLAAAAGDAGDCAGNKPTLPRAAERFKTRLAAATAGCQVVVYTTLQRQVRRGPARRRRGVRDEICPVPLTVRGTQALVSFAPLAFKLFCAARQNAVLRRSSFPSP